MQRAVFGRVAALAAMLAVAPAAAITIGGGGSRSTDCLLALVADANFPVGREKQVRCVDGDPTCDADAEVNGVCRLRVAVCANSTYSPDCTLSGLAAVTVEHAVDTPLDPKFDPDFLALQSRIDNDLFLPVLGADTCTGTVNISVRVKGPFGANNACRRQKKRLKIRSVSTAAVEDTDTLKLFCEPAPGNGCDPQTLFTGTFDRIQTQIFDQSCAVSGCHDSSAIAGDLLLEAGAAYTNLINQPPDNFAAGGAGWLRVDVVPTVSGSPATSFLFRKVEGDLPDPGYGVRMPRERPRLHPTLRGIIEKWISAGAPPTGWVPDTF